MPIFYMGGKRKMSCVTVQIIIQSRDLEVTLNVFLLDFLNINFFFMSCNC